MSTQRRDNPAADTSLTPGGEFSFETYVQWQVPAMAYISRAGAAYYELPARMRLPRGYVSAPVAIPSELTLTVLGNPQASVGLDALSEAQALRVHNPEMNVTGVFGRRRSLFEQRFLSGRLFFFDYVYNPDPQEPSQAVNRLAILGVTQDGGFGFYREVDSLGRGMPRPDRVHVGAFELWASPERQNGGSEILLRDVVVEAGSPHALSGDDDGVYQTMQVIDRDRR